MAIQGILLAGGNGTRLGPLSVSVNKHLLPVHDKPLIYYSLTTMLLAGVKSLIVICKEEDIDSFSKLLGKGEDWGIKIKFAVQDAPEGIPQALQIARNYLDTSTGVVLGLGDNIIYGSQAGRKLSTNYDTSKAKIYCFSVSNPQDFGNLELDSTSRIKKLSEKPKFPASNLAITGFYHLPKDAFHLVDSLKKSERGEYEIIDLLNVYLFKNRLEYEIFPRGTTWLDAGTAQGLTGSSEFVNLIQKRQGTLICSPDEAAWQTGNIDLMKLSQTAFKYRNSDYGKKLLELIESRHNQ